MSSERKRIFIVEDNIENRVITRYALASLNAVLYFDAFGRDIVRRVREVQPIDLILMDLMLKSGTTGYHVFQELQADPILKSIPIVAVSAADPNLAMKQCRQMGFSGFIAKPIQDELFAQQISQALAGSEIWHTG